MIENKKTNYKHISDIIGEWGKWQFLYNAFYFILSAFAAINNMGYSFHAYDNHFWCSDVPDDYPNKTIATQCYQYLNPNQTCNDWLYDRTEFKNSIKTQFNLVCDRSYYASLSQSLYMASYVVSGLGLTYFSDRYGRRPIIWLTMSLNVLALLSCALSVNIYMYLISRFFVGMSVSGMGMGLGTTLVELCGPKHRSDILLLATNGWVLGYVMVPVLAYWLQDYRYMQFLTAFLVFVMTLLFYFLNLESPRWLIANGKVDRAELMINKILKTNGKYVENLNQKLTQMSLQLRISEGKGNKTYTVLDLFKSPNIRKNTLILWYLWIVNTLIYYGFSFNMSDFGGNFYITFLLSGLVELPSQFLCVLLVRMFTRLRLFAFFMLITSFSCLAVIPSTSAWLKVTFALLAKFGISSSWNVMGLLAPEIYPTVLRSTGGGVNSVVGRIGAILGPFMKNFVEYSGLTVVMVMYFTLVTVGAILAQFLPETKGREIPDSLEEAENNQ